MADLLKLNVQERTKLGKGANRRLRLTNMVPGIYYDAKGTNIPVKVEMIPLQKMNQKVGNAQVFEMVLEKDGKTEAIPALLWRIRNEPVKGTPEHVDFFGVDLQKELRIAVHFEILGESTAPGVKLGGVVEIYRDNIEVVCKPMDIPESITIDVSAMELHDTVRIEDVVFPNGVTPLFDDNYAVVSIIEAHGSGAEEETTDEDGAETEVIGEKEKAEAE